MFSPQGAISVVDCRVQENVRSLGGYQCGGLRGVGECSVLRGLLVWWIAGCRRMFGPQGAISVVGCRVQENVQSLGGYQCGGLQGVGECSVLRVYQCGGLQGVGECSVLRGLLVWWIAGCRRMFGPSGAISVVDCRVQENVRSLGGYQCGWLQGVGECSVLGGYQCGGLQGVGECSVLGGLLVWWIAGCRRMFSPWGAISVVDCRVQENVQSLGGYQCGGLQGVGECSVLGGAISMVDCRVQENVRSLGSYQCGGLQGEGECSVLEGLLV